MAFVNVSAARTADPGKGNVWVPKDSFMSSDPFAIVLDVQVDSSLVSSGLLYDVVWQIANPRQDPYTHAWWTPIAGNGVGIPTVDFDWTSVAFQWTNFAVWVSWSHYSDAASQVRGPDKFAGIFYLQGTINVQASSLFGHSSQFWFKARP
jgi:hypothetical protein